MGYSILKRLIKRYNAGTANRAERFLLEAWYRSFGDGQNGIPGIRTTDEERETEERVYARISASISQKTMFRIPSRMVWWAASVLLVATAGFVFYSRVLAPSAFVAYRTAEGQTKKIVLADGTRVWLNGGSSIRYGKGYLKSNRLVEILDGEAYFDVRGNSRLPFVVKAGVTRTQVLGTRFVVSAYQELPGVAIQVTQGMVRVDAGEAQAPGLKAGEAFYVDSKGGKGLRTRFEQALFNPEALRSYFREISFDELAVRIKHSYGYRLHAGNATVRSRKYTGEFSVQEPLEDVIGKLSWIHRGSFRITGKEVWME